MISKAVLVPEIQARIPAGLLSQIQIENWVFNTQIIQAYDGAMPIVITVTVTSLVGGDKKTFKF